MQKTIVLFESSMYSGKCMEINNDSLFVFVIVPQTEESNPPFPTELNRRRGTNHSGAVVTLQTIVQVKWKSICGVWCRYKCT